MSASAYYQRATGQRSPRAIADDRLLGVIREAHEANHFAYGYCKMWLALKRAGEDVGRGRVKRLMAINGIQGANPAASPGAPRPRTRRTSPRRGG